ncbi:apolipoprotein acyltransferase [Sulfitobacter mediterraneus]|uniref:apolipoprotein acyltransferase n=1 Tax=Sulfitobacter mediterraneus TaxID=83219 RepID=UPI001939AE1C|nr:apolipoprotein acyltransferase [Sulfitobacter mediterraneus]MBM1556760.1 apolipoprotein acyltransferase [Sulfitobacter mediterraneus]MBM1568944.1 apolipoprotein acyltransferase [Sulfitobacter mediterraneus]MBM1572372.1 apolipoprotein acyltransferase [Sulfitobacter mediterraneus]MBM1576535.1 apolipoprotein acyltransferase [Sulfitobacter mediterraneus]MBM1579718.1 apolipoprotein acyltransferase [Sulfitobacter mediterraneus]
MIFLVFGILGAIFGGMTAKKRGGNRKDIAQYAASAGIAFALIGLVLTVLLDRWLF